jgi:hypothetical protein
MSTVGKIIVDTEVRGAGFTSGFDKAGKEVKKWAGEIQNVFKGITLQGGIGGLSSVAPALASAAKGAEEFATKLRTGKDVSDHLVSNLTGDIPIVGQFAKAGDSIYELISGEKAAKQHAEELANTAKEVAKNFAEARAIVEGLGKFGFEKARAELKPQLDAQVAPLIEAAEKLKAEREEFKEKGLTQFLASSEEIEADKAKEFQIKSIQEKIKALRLKGVDDGKKLDEEEAEAQHQFQRQAENRLAASKAALDEKVLKKSGDPIDAALTAIRERQRSELDAIQDQTSDFNLKRAGLTDEEIAKRKATANEEKATVEKESAESIAEIQEEQDRKRQEDALVNEEKLKEIRANGNIEHLKILDEQNNQLNEKTGNASRSHLAEQAQIEEEYRFIRRKRR